MAFEFELVDESQELDPSTPPDEPPEDPELMGSVDLEDELRMCGFVDDPEQELWWLPHPIKEDEAVAVIRYDRLHTDTQDRIVRAAHESAKRRELIMRNEKVKDAEAEKRDIRRRVW